MKPEKRGANTWRIGIMQLDDDNRRVWVDRRVLRYPPEMPESEQAQRAQLEQTLLEQRHARGGADAGEHPLTLAEFYRLWIDQHVTPNCSPQTRKGYTQFAETRILPCLGDYPLTSLTPLDITEWINLVRSSPRRAQRKPEAELSRQRTPSDEAKLRDSADKPLSDRTVQHYYDTLASMLDMAVKWQLLERNPCDRVTRPKAHKARINYLTEDQALALVQALDAEPERYRLAVLLALTCGLRLGEVSALRFADVNFKTHEIDISRARKYTPELGNYIGPTKTDASARTLALPDSLLKSIRQAQLMSEEDQCYLSGRWRGDDWIIHQWDGAPLSHDTISKWWRSFADRAGFSGIRYHDLRHTHATILLANGIDVVAVAARLGHANASTTLEVYAHALRRRDQDAADAIEQLLLDNPDVKPPADKQ